VSALEQAGDRRFGYAGRLKAGTLTLLRDQPLCALLGITGMGGVAVAMVTTSMSLFLSDAVGATPLMIGLFFSSRSVIEIASGLVVGAMSDRIGNRRAILALCSFLCAAGAACYYSSRDYYVLLAATAVFFGIGSAGFAQTFAYTWDFAQNRALNATFFNGVSRSVNSMAWIVGPPLAFLMIGAGQGFDGLYLTVAILYVVCGLLCLWRLPNLRVDGREARTRNPFRGIGAKATLMMAAVVLLLAVNTIYQIDIALFVTKDLRFGTAFTGLLIGLAAALEVPVMMYVGARAARIGNWRLVLGAAWCATFFFGVLPLVHERWLLLVLQLPNAVWAAIVLSIPFTIIQDELAGRVGVASALYTSAFQTGIVLGGAVAGIVTQWAGYADVFWACAALTTCAALLLAFGRGHGTQPAAR
jgi:SET family sugar efflux transporter-like MFS transporter